MRWPGWLPAIALGLASALALAAPTPTPRCDDPATDSASLEQLLAYARQLGRAGQPAESLCLARKALAHAPMNSTAQAITYTAVGLYSEELGDPNSSVDAYISAVSALDAVSSLMSQWTPFGDAHPLLIDRGSRVTDLLRDRVNERALALLPRVSDPNRRSSVVTPLLLKAGYAGNEAELRHLLTLMPCQKPTTDAEALQMFSSCSMIFNALDAYGRQFPPADDFASFERRWNSGGLEAMTLKPSAELRDFAKGTLPVLDEIARRLPKEMKGSELSVRAILLRTAGDLPGSKAAYKALAQEMGVMAKDPVMAGTEMGRCALEMGRASSLAMAEDPTASEVTRAARPLCARAFPGDDFAGLGMAAGLDLVDVNVATSRADWAAAERSLLSALSYYYRAEIEPSVISGALERTLATVYLAKGDREAARETLTRSRRPPGQTFMATMNRLAFAQDRKVVVEQAQMLISGYQYVPERKVQPLSFVALMQLSTGELEQATKTVAEIEALQTRASPWLRASTAELKAVLRARAGDLSGAVSGMEQALALREEGLPALAASAEDAQLDALLVALARSSEFGVSLCFSARCEGKASTVALTGVLRQKGRAVDLQATSQSQLRDTLDKDTLALYEQVQEARATLAQQSLSGGESSATRAELARLEQALAARAPAIARVGAKVDLAAVQAKLSDTDALIEIVVYRPFDLNFKPGTVGWGSPRYAAAVLRKKGSPVWKDLGPAEEMEGLVANARQMLADELGMQDTAGTDAAMDALDARLIRPLEGALKGSTRWFVAPDGVLNLVPFGALRAADGRYRLESARIVTLTSGRELLSGGDAMKAGPGVLIGAPDYGPSRSSDSTDRALAAWGSGFSPLPGTLQEVRALRKKLDGATVLTGAAANEAAIKALQHPYILHIATHGFFLGEGDPNSPLTLMPGDALLRSGLALAGANTGGIGGEDGLLTALEAAGLDLRGTQLVVLSACETGVGTIRTGDGVQGMRRALTLAGADSEVLSLWAVDDEATLILMQAFYAELEAGTDRAEALRKAQLALAKSQRYAHPTYWAAWVLSGDDGPMSH